VGAANASLEVEVKPSWPFRLPGRNAPDGVLRVRGGVVHRLLRVDVQPVVVRVWRRSGGAVVFQAVSERAIERMRFALGVDEDLRPFYDAFRSDRLLGPVIRRMPWLRPRRRPWPWEALAWAVTTQLIESPRAAAIQRRIVHRWGPRLGQPGPGALYDVPSAATIATVAPAELDSMDLAPKRSIALRRVAREVAAGSVDLNDPAGDPRLLAIPEIGAWTVQCLGLVGRGDPDTLPAGDLGYVKLVGRLAGLGRRATPEEVEEFFAPYAPYRGLAGTFALAGLHHRIAQGPPLRRAA
jgi:DNA-3-methyladenine glycosylase II